MGWQQRDCNASAFPSAPLVSDLRAVLAYAPPLWARRWPAVASIEADHPCVPVHNRVEENAFCAAAAFVDDGKGAPLNASKVAAEWLSTIADNREAPALCE